MHDSTTIDASAALGDYHFDHFRIGTAVQDMRFSRASSRTGDLLPDATLLNLDGEAVSLRALADGRPVVLVTGSMSCPLTASALPDLNRFEKRYGGRVQFALIQVREAHPGHAISQPLTMNEKIEHAQLMRDVHGVRWPVLVDDIDGSFHHALDTMPNSIHIVAASGEILYRALFAGDAGVEKAIASVAAGDRPRSKQGRSMLPLLKSAGFMHETLVAAGAGAYADVAKSAPPMVVLALGTRLLPFVPKSKRGLTLLIVSAAVGAVIAGLIL